MSAVIATSNILTMETTKTAVRNLHVCRNAKINFSDFFMIQGYLKINDIRFASCSLFPKSQTDNFTSPSAPVGAKNNFLFEFQFIKEVPCFHEITKVYSITLPEVECFYT